ncbi:MAG: acetyl-CoA carboxylase biotin carboxyl carrier protein [Lachnospira sp.]|nr:acetyl-CoA carboxylase biotin carboxyl carrier protein [Lachnospira sp.]
MTVEEIKDLIQALDASDISMLKYKDGDASLCLAKKESSGVVTMPMPPAVQTAAAISVPTTETGSNIKASVTSGNAGKEQYDGNVVVSPLVGTAYMAPSEDSEPFVKVGDIVKKGQTLAIVEAMKLMNEIESDYDGVVTEILVANEETVEYGQPLFVIK